MGQNMLGIVLAGVLSGALAGAGSIFVFYPDRGDSSLVVSQKMPEDRSRLNERENTENSASQSFEDARLALEFRDEVKQRVSILEKEVEELQKQLPLFTLSQNQEGAEEGGGIKLSERLLSLEKQLQKIEKDSNSMLEGVDPNALNSPEILQALENIVDSQEQEKEQERQEERRQRRDYWLSQEYESLTNRMTEVLGLSQYQQEEVQKALEERKQGMLRLWSGERKEGESEAERIERIRNERTAINQAYSSQVEALFSVDQLERYKDPENNVDLSSENYRSERSGRGFSRGGRR